MCVCVCLFKVSWVNANLKKQNENDEFKETSMNAFMIGNNIAFMRKVSAITDKWDKIYSQRAIVHRFVGEGTESGEFPEVREDLGFLEKDYLDIQTDYTYSDSDDYY